mgnify:CR=1 FL=1
MRRPKIDLSTILLLVVVAILGATAVFVYLSLRTDTVTSMADNGETIRVLFVVEEEGTPITSQVLIYNPRTNRAGLFDVPRNLGAILESLNRVDGISTLLAEGEVEAYTEEVEELLGVSIPFYMALDMEGLGEVVDLAEGLELFIAESYQASEVETGVRLPAGNVVLDGAKVQTYIAAAPPGETRTDRIARRMQFTQRFLEMLGERATALRHEQVAPYVTESFETNLDDRSLLAFIGRMSLVDTDQMIQRRIQGNFRTVDSAGETKELLFPHFEGEWLRQSVRQVEQSLASGEDFAEEAITISLEILNGTTVTGLARRTRELYEGYGFDVVSFDNADSSDFEHTRVIDRTGNIELARRAAGIIRATRITSEPLSGESAIDVTVILGQDFDGTYVRE